MIMSYWMVAVSRLGSSYDTQLGEELRTTLGGQQGQQFEEP